MAPLINFQLTPLDEVRLWGTEGARTLHWFAITDGCYWITTDDGDWFRFSDGFLAQLRADDDSVISPYVDYYVARLYEDLLEILPAILEPVPADLHGLISSAESERLWMQACDQWLEVHSEQDSWDTFYQGTGWWGARRLDAGYLRNPSSVHYWCIGDTVRLRWDARNRYVDGVPVWSLEFSEISVSTDLFLSEVTSFHNRLMAEMRQRIDLVNTTEISTGVHVVPWQLRSEQAKREQALTTALRGKAAPTDWSAVRQALTVVGLR